ncbi:hypothetical protein [Psychrobacillus vulpis]|uniref:Uncharacterized protein n=1 Tax=Psychrobacillus vulpis TaxID=2325572 RepID=A0A544TD84_9BACI|nr:hypothetical protein [Psychrobacillus vulpis]TQR15410.1 hypothetical protein FG384_19355 [Psychrobacillus vulpis]
MKIDWQSLKPVQGCLLTGIYANQLNVYQYNNFLDLQTIQLILKIKNPHSLEFWYWKIDWFEDEIGDDFLIIEEQETPEPIEYIYDSEIAPNQHLLMSSSFSVEQNKIKKVSGYGYKDEKSQILTSIVFELEKSFISITTGAVITTKITEKEPEDLGDLIFPCD